MSKYVQYIIVRKDLVPIMGVGKTAAQVAHASLGAVLKGDQIMDHPHVRGWLNGPFTKLVVYVKTKQKLLNLMEKLEEEGIHHRPIYDACRTKLKPEEPGGGTLTCIGLIPIIVAETPKFLRKLQLLEGEDQ